MLKRNPNTPIRYYLTQAIDKFPLCSYSHWLKGSIEMDIAARLPAADPVTDCMIASASSRFEHSLSLEPNENGPMISWAEVLELQAAKLESLNDADSASGDDSADKQLLLQERKQKIESLKMLAAEKRAKAKTMNKPTCPILRASDGETKESAAT